MRCVAIIQARMGSTRLPGKVLMPLAGRPVLQRVIERVGAAEVFDEIVVATTVAPADNALAHKAGKWGARVVRGDELDVLSRYAKAAQESTADIIVRITADCPLIEPTILSEMVTCFRAGLDEMDILTNARQRSFPRGLDVEIFARAALDQANLEAREAHQREHVTPYLYEHPQLFRIVDFVGEPDLSAMRWTLDTPEDFEFLRMIYNSAPSPDLLCVSDVLILLSENPGWLGINAHIEQKRV